MKEPPKPAPAAEKQAEKKPEPAKEQPAVKPEPTGQKAAGVIPIDTSLPGAITSLDSIDESKVVGSEELTQIVDLFKPKSLKKKLTYAEEKESEDALSGKIYKPKKPEAVISRAVQNYTGFSYGRINQYLIDPSKFTDPAEFTRMSQYVRYIDMAFNQVKPADKKFYLETKHTMRTTCTMRGRFSQPPRTSLRHTTRRKCRTLPKATTTRRAGL